MKATLKIDSEVSLESLAWSIAMSEVPQKQVIEFVVQLDEYMSDLQFTVALRDKLNEVIERESE